MTEVASGYAEIGQKGKALEILPEALQVAKTVVVEGKTMWLLTESLTFLFIGESEPTALATVASKYAEVGEEGKAIEILSEALQAVKEIEDFDRPSFRAKVLAEIAGGYVQAGQKKKSLEILASALLLAKSIEDPSIKDRVLYFITERYAKAGQYHRSLRIVTNIDRPFYKVLALLEIADEYSNSGQMVDIRAKKILHEIITGAK